MLGGWPKRVCSDALSLFLIMIRHMRTFSRESDAMILRCLTLRSLPQILSYTMRRVVNRDKHLAAVKLVQIAWRDYADRKNGLRTDHSFEYFQTLRRWRRKKQECMSVYTSGPWGGDIRNIDLHNTIIDVKMAMEQMMNMFSLKETVQNGRRVLVPSDSQPDIPGVLKGMLESSKKFPSASNSGGGGSDQALATLASVQSQLVASQQQVIALQGQLIRAQQELQNERRERQLTASYVAT